MTSARRRGSSAKAKATISPDSTRRSSPRGRDGRNPRPRRGASTGLGIPLEVRTGGVDPVRTTSRASPRGVGNLGATPSGGNPCASPSPLVADSSLDATRRKPPGHPTSRDDAPRVYERAPEPAETSESEPESETSLRSRDYEPRREKIERRYSSGQASARSSGGIRGSTRQDSAFGSYGDVTSPSKVVSVAASAAARLREIEADRTRRRAAEEESELRRRAREIADRTRHRREEDEERKRQRAARRRRRPRRRREPRAEADRPNRSPRPPRRRLSLAR